MVMEKLLQIQLTANNHKKTGDHKRFKSKNLKIQIDQ